jgi:putative heme-binding domain-containing protein
MKSLLLFLIVLITCPFAFAEEANELNPKDNLIIETVLRLQSFDLESSPPAKAAVLRYLKARAGTDQYFQLIERFKPIEIAEELSAFALEHAEETAGVRAAELLFVMNQQQRLLDLTAGDNAAAAITAIGLIGRSGGGKVNELLTPILTSDAAAMQQRIAAIAAIGRRTDGQKQILELVKQASLPEDLMFAAANVLLSSEDESIASEASKHLTLPATADSQPLPPLAELIARRGDVAAGETAFRTQGTCSNCHKVNGVGKEVGPDLSEIGSKLSRDAMYVAILDPSAAVSHNFETYALLTDDGAAITGLLISETDEAITLRTSEGIDKTVDRETVEVFEKKTKSMMPQDLQRLLTVDQLVNIVEYTMSLTKK